MFGKRISHWRYWIRLWRQSLKNTPHNSPKRKKTCANSIDADITRFRGEIIKLEKNKEPARPDFDQAVRFAFGFGLIFMLPDILWEFNYPQPKKEVVVMREFYL
jgi:hypothetical protein